MRSTKKQAPVLVDHPGFLSSYYCNHTDDGLCSRLRL